jgi:phosphatidylglycerophosphatase A
MSVPPRSSAHQSPAAAAAIAKPRFAVLVATACGLGYLPKAPGTFGSVAGLVAAMLPWLVLSSPVVGGGGFDPYLASQIGISVIIAVMGIWSASVAAKYWSQEDPQQVVIDEVSGQHLALLLGCAVPVWWKGQPTSIDTKLGFITLHSALNWKYLLVGFILFRVFDIWKPFPARQAESLPGGWGIMADDWMAGIYAGIALWVARAAGL